ncbi:hypothetical protein LP419_04350 [Massilia sp. H-1]|nr:hypothetical protein LP419_04350 [Massilia sp. H-1]
MRFGRLVTLLLHDAVKDPAAIREFEKIAPLLPDLAKPESTKASKLVAADAWRMGGIVLTSLGQLPEAMDLLMRALRIYDANDDQEFETGRLPQCDRAGPFQDRLGWKKHCAKWTARSRSPQRPRCPTRSRAAICASRTSCPPSYRVDEQYQALLSARTLAQSEKNDYNLAVIATNLADVALQKKDYVAALQVCRRSAPAGGKIAGPGIGAGVLD